MRFFPIVFLVLIHSDAIAQRTTLLEAGSGWNYLYDGVDPEIAWREADFDDSDWQSGPAPLGSGREDVVTDLGELDGANTAYFRTTFEVDGALLDTLTSIEIEIKRQHGAAVYLNGTEIPRFDLTGGEFIVDRDRFHSSQHFANLLVSGTNILAIELQASSNGDKILDVKVTGNAAAPTYGDSRPPCTIDFESAEYRGGGVVGITRAIAPRYDGIGYSYREYDSWNFPTNIEHIDGASFNSRALASLGNRNKLNTAWIDVHNYRDVRISLDLLTAGQEFPSIESFNVAFIVKPPSLSEPNERIEWLQIEGDKLPITEPIHQEDSPARYIVPAGPADYPPDWIQPTFDDSGWSEGDLGIGFDRNSTFLPFLGTDLEEEMDGINTSVLMRIPFELTAEALASVDQAFLDVRYDDGFVAWLNGTEIARRNAPETLEWNSSATGQNSDNDAIIYEPIPLQDLTLLQTGSNVLALHGMNDSVGSSDVLFHPRLTGGANIEPTEDDFIFYRRDRFTTLETPPSLIPDDAASLLLTIASNTDVRADGIAVYLDNITVTGTPIVPDSFPTALSLNGYGNDDIDPDGDGIELLLEYAFGGNFSQGDDHSLLLPQVAIDELGFMTVKFRMLDGFRIGNGEIGFDVADLRYTPELTHDLSNWQDGQGVPSFGHTPEITDNGDGTVNVTLRSQRRLSEERTRAYFRLKVEVVRPPGVVLTAP